MLTSNLLDGTLVLAEFMAGVRFSSADQQSLRSDLVKEFHRNPAFEFQGEQAAQTWLQRIRRENLAEQAKTRTELAAMQHFAKTKPGEGTELHDMVERYAPVLASDPARHQVLTRRDAEAITAAHQFVAAQIGLSLPSDLQESALEKWMLADDADVKKAFPNLVLAQWSWANVQMVWPRLNQQQRQQVLAAARSAANAGKMTPLTAATDRVQVECGHYLVKTMADQFAHAMGEGLEINALQGAVAAGRP